MAELGALLGWRMNGQDACPYEDVTSDAVRSAGVAERRREWMVPALLHV
jgi:hypothetical protein